MIRIASYRLLRYALCSYVQIFFVFVLVKDTVICQHHLPTAVADAFLVDDGPGGDDNAC